VQLSKGVEWAVHCCTILALLAPGRGLSADALARFFDVPPAYLGKQLQALRRAGLVASVRGKSGGYRLDRETDRITLLDITLAIEGVAPAFRCTEIRQNGPCGLAPHECREPCNIARAFAEAEIAWREALDARTLADIMREAASENSADHMLEVAQWVRANE